MPGLLLVLISYLLGYKWENEIQLEEEGIRGVRRHASYAVAAACRQLLDKRIMVELGKAIEGSAIRAGELMGKSSGIPRRAIYYRAPRRRAGRGVEWQGRLSRSRAAAGRRRSSRA